MKDFYIRARQAYHEEYDYILKEIEKLEKKKKEIKEDIDYCTNEINSEMPLGDYIRENYPELS